MRVAFNNYIVVFSLMIIHCSSGAAGAAIACYQCHGTEVSSDYRPADAPYRTISTGGFQGNHQTHMDAPASPGACEKCHPGSGGYASSHRDGKIKLSSRANGSPLTTRYNNSTTAFPQTATPALATCSNVNCHFESATPSWGSASYSSTSHCNQCHEGAVPLTATHATHKRYSTGLMGKFSSYAACVSCHVNYASPPSFKHATSAGRRPINVSVGNYTSSSKSYLPSQTHGGFGSCSALYCHSPGNKASGFDQPNAVARWGGSLTCKGCHKSDAASLDNMASGSHGRHVNGAGGYYKISCIHCHAETITTGMAIKDVSKHTNGTVQVAFNSTSTAANGKYNGAFAPVSKTPGTAYGTCENVYCHSNGQNNGGGGITYVQPTWGNSATGKCGTCHDAQVSHAGSSASQISTGSHTKHLARISLASSALRRCILCHNVGNLAWPGNSCTNTCHVGISKHVDHQINVAIPAELGATPAYNGSPNPGSGYGTCSNVYCHSNGISVSTGTVPANTSPAWGSGVMACNGCHGNLTYSDSRTALPLYTSNRPGTKANSHKAHYSIGCNKCHQNTTTDGVTITNTANHINRVYNVNAGGGVSFSYTFNAAGGSCSSISCHFNGSAQWGATIACGGCHGVTAITLAGRGHFTHLSSAFGPRSTCDACHGTGASTGEHAGHGGGTINFADGTTLASTTSCNTCHSPGGAYDGVGNGTYGARVNWTQGVYSSALLKGGKEKWCASCHDDIPSIISGITAPNIVGNESGAYTYGSGWGYYKTGHGLPSSQKYPASGGVTSGAAVECNSCHDYSTSHIDGLARTYDDGDSATLDPSYYRQGYRLKLVAAGQGTGATGREPMLVPAPITTANSANNHRMCVICHDSGPFVDSGNMSTNLVTDGVNRHEYHLKNIGTGRRVSADWSNTAACSSDWTQCNSRMTCTSCHNVHGSTRLAMINDGKLVAREPGLKYWNYSSNLVTFVSPPDTQPTPVSLPLTASSGTVWSGGSSSNLCSHCHGNNWLTTESRTPFQNVAVAPVLSWAGTAGFEADGVNPDTAGGGSSFTFRVKYADGNNDAPSVYQVWVDTNDNGAYDPGEKFDMSALDAGSYFSGRIYTLSMPLYKQGDNTLNYRFYFKDAASEATGDPVSNHQVTVTNSVPTLSWTGETNYLTDGVDPNTGGNGFTFTFRVKYTDQDNEAPDADGVRVLINGTYYTLDPEGGGSYGTGKIYSKGITLSTPGDLNYRFVAKDPAGVSATGDPAIDHVVTVLVSSNNPPLLSWTSANCLTEGVRPRTGAKDADFEFRVKYSDADNQCPPTPVQVTVNGTAYDLTSNDGASCQTGRTYYSSLAVATTGDLNYSFSATDGIDAATGTPTANHTVSVVNTTFKVRPTGGGGWYSTIASAITASSDPSSILVYPNADFTAYTYPEGGISFAGKPNRALQAVCGRDLTTISGGATAVSIGSNNVIVDGFTITGGTTYGVYFNSGAAISGTVKNSRIDSNATGIYLNLNSTATIEDSLVQNNTTRGIYSVLASSLLKVYRSTISGNNPGGAANAGGGISYSGGSGTHIIEDCVISNNKSGTANAGGIYLLNGSQVSILRSTINNNSGANGGGIFNNNANPVLTIANSFIQGNSATASGGGIYMNTGTLTMSNVVLTGNKATTNGGGIYTNSSSASPAVDCLYCTISANYANVAGAIYRNAGTVAVKNSIIYNNDAATQPNYKQIYANGGNWQSVDVYNTLINQIPGSATYTFGYESLGGNLNEGTRGAEVPSFADPRNPSDAPTAAGNHGIYSLQSSSWCIDTGGNYPATPNKDIEGQDRPYDVSGTGDGTDDYDMGAYEYRP